MGITLGYLTSFLRARANSSMGSEQPAGDALRSCRAVRDVLGRNPVPRL